MEAALVREEGCSLDRLTRLDAGADALRAELAAAPPSAPTFDRKALEQRLHVKLADWRGLLTSNVATGNAMLRTLLARADQVYTGG